MLQRGGFMDELWKGIIYGYPGAKHVCDDFGVVLACNGERDLMMCQKCGRGWIAPCHIEVKTKEQKQHKRI